VRYLSFSAWQGARADQQGHATAASEPRGDLEAMDQRAAILDHQEWVKMTGMPAFGSTHSDEQIRNIVGFVRRLPQISPTDFRAMESKFGSAGAHEEEGHHQ
jgi:mono/diheme cytochrome c family protein